MPVESALRTASASSQRWLAAGDAVGVIPGEESVTDLVLLSLASIPGNICRVHRVPKNVEGQVGPDFVLWLVSSRNGTLWGLPLLVQAKRLYPNGHFEALHAVSVNHPQIGILTTVAERWGVLPVYALYQPPGSRVAGAPSPLSSQCALIATECPLHAAGPIHPADHPAHPCAARDEADLGVALIRADRVAAETHADAPSVGQLGPHAVPFACIARCLCLEHAAAGPPGEDPNDPGGNDEGGPTFDDLVAVASRRLYTNDELQAQNPQEVPGWITASLQDRGGTAVEQRSIANDRLASEVGRVVVLTDATPDQLG